MTKARDLANFVSAGNPLDNTTLEVADISDLTATAAELNYTDGVTSAIQTQLDAKVDLTGDTMTGNLSFGDNVQARFGAGPDLLVYHDGGHSYVTDSGTGNLYISGDNVIIRNTAGTDLKAQYISDGAVNLFYDNSKKFETTTSGVTVTGTVTATAFSGDGSALTGIQAGAGLFKGENGSTGDTTNGAGDIFRINNQTLNTNVTIDSTENASCAGPLAIATGVTLTVNGNLTVV